MHTMIFRCGLVCGVLQLEAIRLEEAETKDREENFIAVFFEI